MRRERNKVRRENARTLFVAIATPALRFASPRDGPVSPGTNSGVRHGPAGLVRQDMTRFDRLWEPLMVLVAALVILSRSF